VALNDTTVVSGTTYYYRVRAENDISYSAWAPLPTDPQVSVSVP
jgi:hypothetical protein